MGFNKRFYSKELIIKRYESRGAEGVMDLFSKIQGELFEDSFSSKIGDAVYKKNLQLITELIENEINKNKNNEKN